jgi:glutaredoxin
VVVCTVEDPVAGHNRLAPAVPKAGMRLTLYQLDGCPYCEKVADRLDELGVDYETEWVEAMHSERDEVKRLSGQRGVPVLVDDETGVTMAESDRILEYVNTRYA